MKYDIFKCGVEIGFLSEYFFCYNLYEYLKMLWVLFIIGVVVFNINGYILYVLFWFFI